MRPKKKMTEAELKNLISALKANDHDSFATFRGGLRENWPFFIAIVGVAMWVFNSFGNQVTTNLQQDARIDVLTNSLTQLTNTVSNLSLQVEKDNDTKTQIQQDIALIKADIIVIKDSLE